LRDLRRDRSRVIRLTILSTAAYIFMVTMNFLANYLPLNDITTGAISDRYANPFTPAGFTFSIWGLIYLLLAGALIFLIRGVVKKWERPEVIMVRISWPFIISSLLNGLWIVSWHYDQILLSLIIMLGILFSLIWLYRSMQDLVFSPGRYLLPFSVYLGWISVATVANVTVYTVAVDWGRLGMSDDFWLAAVFVAVLFITGYMVFGHNDIAFALVVLWALTGIFAARWQEAGGVNFAAAAALAAGLIVMGLIIKKMRLNQKF